MITQAEKEYSKKHYQENRAKILERVKAYNKVHDQIPERKQASAERHHKYYMKHKIGILTRQSETERKYNQTERGKQIAHDANLRMRAKYPDKYKTRVITRNAIARGLIQKQPCEVCGSLKVEVHHPDYSKPFDIRWLCHQHHCEAEGRWIPRN